MSEVSAAAAKAFIAMAPEHKVLMAHGFHSKPGALDRIDFSKGNGVEGWPCCSCATKIGYSLGSP